VERQAAKDGQHVRRLEPSATGWKMLDQFAVIRRTVLSERLGSWTDEERSTLIDLLERFAAAIVTSVKAATVKTLSRHRR
jgi:hypothetical protein